MLALVLVLVVAVAVAVDVDVVVVVGRLGSRCLVICLVLMSTTLCRESRTVGPRVHLASLAIFVILVSTLAILNPGRPLAILVILPHLLTDLHFRARLQDCWQSWSPPLSGACGSRRLGVLLK